jgi:hypothetical protein
MILALKSTNSLNTFTERTAKEWLNAYYNDKEYPKTRLDNFLNLFKKIQSNEMLQYIQSKKFESSDSVNESMERINEYRNIFVHFQPGSWSLEANGLPKTCLSVIEVITFLFQESGNIYFYSADDASEVTEMIYDLTEQLKRWEVEYLG